MSTLHTVKHRLLTVFLDENVLSSSSVFASAPSSDSQQISSVSHQVDSTDELSRVSRDDQNFHILADAAAVSSDQ